MFVEDIQTLITNVNQITVTEMKVHSVSDEVTTLHNLPEE